MTPTSNRPVDWERLITENENRLYRAALAILGDRAEAEDAVQETFMKYLEKRPRLDGPAHERNWLMRVTVNACKTRLRSPWRRNVSLDEALTAAAPEERTELEELLSLPPKERLVIHLYYYEGYKTAEIARLTGEREGTVRARMSRARARLRTLLADEEEL